MSNLDLYKINQSPSASGLSIFLNVSQFLLFGFCDVFKVYCKTQEQKYKEIHKEELKKQRVNKSIRREIIKNKIEQLHPKLFKIKYFPDGRIMLSFRNPSKYGIDFFEIFNNDTELMNYVNKFEMKNLINILPF